MKRSIHLATLAAIASTTMLIACSGGDGGNNATAGGGSGPAQRQPGMWEMNNKITQMQLTGASPEMQARANAQIGRVQTASQCLTAAEAGDPLAQMRQLVSRQAATANCQFSEQVFAGGTIRVRANCPAAGGGAVTLSVNGTFTETTMQAVMNVGGEGPPGPDGITGMRLTMEANGRRTGPCPGAG